MACNPTKCAKRQELSALACYYDVVTPADGHYVAIIVRQLSPCDIDKSMELNYEATR